MKLYRLSRRGIEVTSEVICDRHYEIESQPGRSMDQLSDREKHVGMTQSVTEYSGVYPCATCEEIQQRSKESE